MQELIQIEVRFEVRLIWEAGLESTFEVVKLLDGCDTCDREIDLALVSVGSEQFLEVSLDGHRRELWLEVTFTIERSSLDETLVLVIFDFKKDAIGRDLL